MSQTVFQSANSPYYRFIRQESEYFYQASLLLPEEKHSVSWALFALWHGLNPFEFWNSAEPANRFIRNWKGRLFFGDGYESSLTVSQTAWIDLQKKFESSFRKLLVLDVLNGLDSSIGAIRFPSFSELEFFLNMIGGSMAVSSAQVLFSEEIESGLIDFLEPLAKLGSALLLWKLLQNTFCLVEQGKLFVPLDDLILCNCKEEQLLEEDDSSSLRQLTKMQLERAYELFKIVKKSAASYPKGLKESLTFLSNAFSGEISSTLRSDWVLSSKQNPLQKQGKTNWFINSLTKIQRNGLIKLK